MAWNEVYIMIVPACPAIALGMEGDKNMESASEFVESRRPSLTDVEGILVGHFTLP